MNEHPVSYPESDALGAALGAYRSNPTPEAWRAVKDAVGSDSDSDDLAAVDALILDLAAAHVGDDNDAKAAALSQLPQSRKDALKELDAARPLDVLKPGNELEPPARAWILDAWLPAGRIAIFTGEGGSGKSFLALQLATAIASGSDSWIASRTEAEAAPAVLAGAAPVVYAGWEDEYTEIERRLMSIHAVHGGRPLNDNLHTVYLGGRGPLWGPSARLSGHISTAGELKPVGVQIRALCEDVGARLLVIDPRAAAYGGEENTRALVRHFMADWDAWGQSAGCAILIVHHPPKAANDNSPGGSADWLAAARAGWELRYDAKPKRTGKDKSPPWAGPDKALVLECIKSSYAPLPRRPVWLETAVGGVKVECPAPAWVTDEESEEQPYDLWQ